MLLAVDKDGPPLGDDRSASDLVGDALSIDATWVAIPVERLHGDFLRLASGMAGGFLQKFVNYGRHVAIVGDISALTARSEPLAAFVRESNRGGHIWFVDSREELDRRLSAVAAQA